MPREIKTCTQADCNAKHYARERCKRHYMKWRYNNRPEGVQPIAAPGDCPECQPLDTSETKRGYICTDCLNRFQSWLRSIL